MYLLLSPSPRLPLCQRSSPRRVRRGPKHDRTGGRSKCQPKTRGSKQHSKISALRKAPTISERSSPRPETRGPKQHPKISASRKSPTVSRRSGPNRVSRRPKHHPKTTNRTNSTDFLLRIIRAGYSAFWAYLFLFGILGGMFALSHKRTSAEKPSDPPI